MSGSTFGTLFRITTWGESHGAGIGVVIDGCPAGLSLSEADIQAFLDRRKPGQSKYTTKRQEGDQVEILSGVFEGQTTGTPTVSYTHLFSKVWRNPVRSPCRHWSLSCAVSSQYQILFLRSAGFLLHYKSVDRSLSEPRSLPLWNVPRNTVLRSVPA